MDKILDRKYKKKKTEKKQKRKRHSGARIIQIRIIKHFYMYCQMSVPSINLEVIPGENNSKMLPSR